jgi:hypothetical protein
LLTLIIVVGGYGGHRVLADAAWRSFVWAMSPETFIVVRERVLRDVVGGHGTLVIFLELSKE